jgi:sulfonate transport system permease protein
MTAMDPVVAGRPSTESERQALPGRWRGRATGLLLPSVGLVAWEVCSRSGELPPNWVPAPSTLLRTIVRLAESGELLAHVGATLSRVIAGFAVGATLGTLCGAAAGQSARFRKLVDPTLQALRSVPSMAWAPLFLLWMGIGEGSKVALIVAGVFFPIYLNLCEGILHVDRKLLEVGRLHGYRGLAFVRRIVLPATLPAYLVGLRSGLGLGWMFVVAAEIVGASRGLGFLMVDGEQTGRPELIMSSIVLFAILGKATDALLEALSRRLLRWKIA